MLNGLKRMWRGYRLLRRYGEELTGLREAVEDCAVSLKRLAEVHAPLPAAVPQDASDPAELAYVDTFQQAALMDIELRLTQARGQAPTEDEILAEYERRFGSPPAGSV